MIIRQKVYLMQFLCLLIFSPLLHAQDIVVREIPSLDKLPVNAIHRIFQDSDGYMWYGTFNGLCRNDGYNIRVFRSDLYHPGLLSDKKTRILYRIIILLISPKTTTKKSGSEP